METAFLFGKMQQIGAHHTFNYPVISSLPNGGSHFQGQTN
jgi:hypothetical protein